MKNFTLLPAKFSSSLKQLLNGTTIPISSIVLFFVAVLFTFSCSQKDENILSITANENNEIKLAEEGFLIFDSWDSFVKYSNLPPSELPKNFTSLNQVIRDHKAVYQKTQNINDLNNFYKFENGTLLPNYPFMGFTSILDKNKIVQVDNKLIKLDFDEVKESVNQNYLELCDDINIKKVPSASSYSFEDNFTRRSYTCIGYLQIAQIYNFAAGTYIADDMTHPDPVIGTFRADGGGSLHYTGNSSSYSKFLMPFNSTSNPHGYSPVSISLPCSDVYVTFTSWSGRIEFTSVGVNVNCDYDGIPSATGSLMNGCN